MRAHLLFSKVILAIGVACGVTQGFTVNYLNGGASVINIDFSIAGTVIPLELVRTYNTITAINEQSGWHGSFGWGWTSPFETTLTTTPERHVLLRDALTGNTALFRPPKDDPSIKKQFFAEVKRAYFEDDKKRKLTAAELDRLQLPTHILARLESDPRYRAELAFRYGIKTQVPQGGIYTSTEYGYQSLQFKNNQWIREKDGIRSVFDKEGRLIRQIDKNGYTFVYEYHKNEPSHVSEIRSSDRALNLKFQWRNNHVIEITDNRNRISRYSYDEKGNLTKAIDSNGQTYLYQYLDAKFPHLITRVDYPNESVGKNMVYRKIRYDKAGLVVYHRDKDGTETDFNFGKSATDPDNHFWTKSVVKAKGKAEERYDEFFLLKRPDGTKYLYKQIATLGGATTTTIYNSCCGQPEQITKNGLVTNFKYYPNGLLKERTAPNEEVKLEYDLRWKKISKVSQNELVSNYAYDVKGNLTEASNSRNEKVTLKYD